MAQDMGRVDAFFWFIPCMGRFALDFHLELGQAGSSVDQPAQGTGAVQHIAEGALELGKVQGTSSP